MINPPNIICSTFRRFMLSLGLSVCLLFLFRTAYAQENPPRPIKVTVSTFQHLSFGSFILTNPNGYGTVTVDVNGGRGWSGNILLIDNSIFSPALFDVEAQPGSLINIEYVRNATLTGSNTGTIALTLDAQPYIDFNLNLQPPFIASKKHTLIYIGGMLSIGSLSANPAGEYSGTFFVTFTQIQQ